MSRSKRGNRWIPLMLGLALGSTGTAAAIKILRNRRPPVVIPPALTVNGQAVSMGEFEGVLKLTAGSQILQSLIEEQLVLQEAERLKVRLTPDQEAELEKAAGQLPNADLAVIAKRRARTALLERRLLLQGVEEATLRDIYEQFKPQLVQYELFVIVLATQKDGKDVARSLQDGVSFDILARNLSLDPSKAQGGRLGTLTHPQIERLMGQPVADAVRRLKPDSVSGTLFSNHGLVIVKLGKVLESYEELRPTLESLVAQSRRAQFLTELLLSARIHSPFLTSQPTAPSASKPSGILADPNGQPAGLPAPELKVQGAHELAPPSDRGSRPRELPRPTGASEN